MMSETSEKTELALHTENWPVNMVFALSPQSELSSAKYGSMSFSLYPQGVLDVTDGEIVINGTKI